jgi:hypothetical protein
MNSCRSTFSISMPKTSYEVLTHFVPNQKRQDANGHPKGVFYNGETWVAATDFNKLLIRAHPSSRLSAAISPSKDNSMRCIRLYYQMPDKHLHEYIYTNSATWQPAATLGLALTGTGIAASSKPCQDVEEVAVTYQTQEGTFDRKKKTGSENWSNSNSKWASPEQYIPKREYNVTLM